MAKNNCHGFTLLELLLALAIAALILVAAYTTLFSLTKAQETASTGMEKRRALRNTMDLLRRELTSTLFKSGDTRLRFIVEDRDYYGKPASTIQFATLTAPSEGLATDQLRVRYQTTEKSNSSLTVRRTSRVFFADEDQKNGYPLLDETEGFLVECYDGSKWVKAWDTTLNPALPKMIRVTITIQEANQKVPYRLIATPRMVLP